MNIFIDIGHPAHVHYFRNFIAIMEERGHKFLITARNKEIVHELLRAYNIQFVNRGDGSSSILGKILYMFKADYILVLLARKFKPDLFLSFGSPYAAQVSKLLRRKHIAFDDTEAATLSHIFYRPFTDKVYTPSYFLKDFGKKHEKFNGFMELCYLHPKYFVPDSAILSDLGIKKDEKFAMVRFVKWSACHDFGESGIHTNNKVSLIHAISKHAKVFITSEEILPPELEMFRIKLPADKIHHAMAFASLFIGESPTMTTESALMGVPAICISSWACNCGNFVELKKYGLIYCYTPDEEELAFEKAEELISHEFIKETWMEKTKILLKEKIDVTNYLIEVVEKSYA